MKMEGRGFSSVFPPPALQAQGPECDPRYNTKQNKYENGESSTGHDKE